MGEKKKNSDKVILVRGAGTVLKRTLSKLALSFQKNKEKRYFTRVSLQSLFLSVEKERVQDVNKKDVDQMKDKTKLNFITFSIVFRQSVVEGNFPERCVGWYFVSPIPSGANRTQVVCVILASSYNNKRLW